MSLHFTKESLMTYLEAIFPQVHSDFAIDELGTDHITARLLTAERHLRPGGTVSGPAMFALADVAAYMMVLARLGDVPLAVTTNCSLDFIRKPAANTDILAKVRLLKLGRSLAVTDMLLYSEGSDDPVARANMTYAIPPTR
jgi:uncharacterized protein (TIGR00369 family)